LHSWGHGIKLIAQNDGPSAEAGIDLHIFTLEATRTAAAMLQW
jgi:hypothetical protein